jgi:hypothetical protein
MIGGWINRGGQQRFVMDRFQFDFPAEAQRPQRRRVFGIRYEVVDERAVNCFAFKMSVALSSVETLDIVTVLG